MAEAVVSLAGEGIGNVAFGERRIRVASAHAGGALAIWEETVPPGGGPPMHVHHREDEQFLVVEGEFRFVDAAGTDRRVGPGGIVFLPRGVPHAFRNVGATPGRLMITVVPGGFEEFFLEIERQGLGPDSPPARIEAIAERWGLDFVGPPLAG